MESSSTPINSSLQNMKFLKTADGTEPTKKLLKPFSTPTNSHWDIFDLHGKTYMVYANRYTGWIEDCHNMRCVKELVLHIWCTGGYIIRWKATIWLTGKQLIPGRNVYHLHITQSNGRAELAVKTAKRMLMDCIDGHGHPTPRSGVIMTHWNTPPSGPWLVTSGNVVQSSKKNHLPILWDAPDSQTLKGDKRVERKCDGEKTPVKPKAVKHA